MTFFSYDVRAMCILQYCLKELYYCIIGEQNSLQYYIYLNGGRGIKVRHFKLKIHILKHNIFFYQIIYNIHYICILSTIDDSWFVYCD